jgi:hypothetical protein
MPGVPSVLRAFFWGVEMRFPGVLAAHSASRTALRSRYKSYTHFIPEPLPVALHFTDLEFASVPSPANNCLSAMTHRPLCPVYRAQQAAGSQRTCIPWDLTIPEELHADIVCGDTFALSNGLLYTYKQCTVSVVRVRCVYGECIVW